MAHRRSGESVGAMGGLRMNNPRYSRLPASATRTVSRMNFIDVHAPSLPNPAKTQKPYGRFLGTIFLKKTHFDTILCSIFRRGGGSPAPSTRCGAEKTVSFI
jgi:hypothetical protein